MEKYLFNRNEERGHNEEKTREREGKEKVQNWKDDMKERKRDLEGVGGGLGGGSSGHEDIARRDHRHRVPLRRDMR